MSFGIFGNMFDFNRDGKLDSFERAADFVAFVNLTSSTEDEADSDEHSSALSLGSNAEDEEDDDVDEYDFKGTGYSLDELEMMDDDEREEILLDAGLDVDDYDF